MQVLLKLYNMEKPAADGSIIPRRSTEEYLAGDDYKQVIADQLALGGVTHKDRKVDGKYQDVIAPDDQILVSNNVTHYITEIYTKPGDEYCYAVVQILNPDDYSGERRDNIVNLIADLKAGIKLPCSVVISGLWSCSEVCEKINRIKGVDFTLGPSFEGSGTIKVFSSIVPRQNNEYSIADDNKSLEGLTYKTVKFSTVAEIMPEGGSGGSNPTQLSILDVKEKYGLFSKEYKSMKSEGLEFISKEDLKRVEDATEELKSFSDDSDDNSDELLRGILLRSMGNNIKLVDDLMKTHKKQLLQVISSVPGVNGIPDEQKVGERINELLRSIPKVMQFSTINSVRDRMYFNKYPRYSLIRRMIHSYRDYFNNREQISDHDLIWLQTLLIQDIAILLKNVIPNIVKGSNLNALYSLIQFNQEISDAGLELSNLYRQLLLSEKILGFVPEKKYKTWKLSLTNFLNAISKYAFNRELVAEITAMDTLIKL